MRKPFSYFLLVALLAAALIGANTSTKFKPIQSGKHLERNLVQVADKLWACKFEVSNIDFREFLAATATSEDLTTHEYYPDTAGWTSFLKHGDPLQNVYDDHPAFNPYPVVNISYEAAQAYCEWLTEKYNEMSNRKFDKVRVRLPSKAEWEQAARLGLENEKTVVYAWPGWYVHDKRGHFRANFRYVVQSAITVDPETKKPAVATDEPGSDYFADKYMITAPVDGFPASPGGMYQVCGNVAEMVAEKGITKGGSWNSPGYYLQLDREDTYVGPNPFVGFRFFVEVE